MPELKTALAVIDTKFAKVLICSPLGISVNILGMFECRSSLSATEVTGGIYGTDTVSVHMKKCLSVIMGEQN